MAHKNAVVLRILTKANHLKEWDAKLRASFFLVFKKGLAAGLPNCDDTEGERHGYSCNLGAAANDAHADFYRRASFG